MKVSAALTFVSNAPLPVFGSLPSTNKLELVGGEPLAPVFYRGSLTALTQFVDIKQSLVLAALHLDTRLPVVEEGLKVRDGGEPLQHQVVRVVVEVLVMQRRVVEPQVRAVMGENVLVGRRVRGHHGDGGGI